MTIHFINLIFVIFRLDYLRKTCQPKKNIYFSSLFVLLEFSPYGADPRDPFTPISPLLPECKIITWWIHAYYRLTNYGEKFRGLRNFCGILSSPGQLRHLFFKLLTKTSTCLFIFYRHLWKNLYDWYWMVFYCKK